MSLQNITRKRKNLRAGFNFLFVLSHREANPSIGVMVIGKTVVCHKPHGTAGREGVELAMTVCVMEQKHVMGIKKKKE